MPTTRQELEARISAFRNDVRVPNAALAGVTTVCFAICALAITAEGRRVLGLGAWVLFGVCAAGAVMGIWWWGNRLRTARRRHGLLCPSCGRFITKTGFRGILSTSRCEHCNASL